MQLAKTLLLLSAIAATGALLLWKLGDHPAPVPQPSASEEPPTGDPVADLPVMEDGSDAGAGLTDDLAVEDVPEDALDPAATGAADDAPPDDMVLEGLSAERQVLEGEGPVGESIVREPIDPAASAAAEQAGVAYLEEIRQLPEAAPLLDDILTFLREDGGDTIGLENLEVDENGAALLDEDYTRSLIKDPEIRAKWDKLTKIIAQAHKDGTLKAR